MRDTLVVGLLVLILLALIWNPYHYWQMMHLFRSVGMVVVGFIIGYVVGKMSK